MPANDNTLLVVKNIVAFVKTMTLEEIWRNAWPMLLISIITLALAVGLVKSKLQ